ncbi:phosphoenolpyruvate synthase [Candidatus Dependentiae bacterium]|nr:phosphoenolpyruvate synthase [Candidatus Dependentiae bacterium]
MEFIKKFESISISDLPLVGGKNASLGEMIQKLTPLGLTIPSGFVITVEGYKKHLQKNNLESQIAELLQKIDKNNLKDFSQIGEKIRSLITQAQLPEELIREITEAYKQMESTYGKNCDVAVRSSATAEDLPEASFAGQQETFLNVRGETELLYACSHCFASLFTNRAISYRIDHGFEHTDVLISLGIQKMVRSDLASAGVIFTLDTESGHKEVILINSSYGLGENIVKGVVNPDEFFVHKPTLEQGFRPILKKRCGSKKSKLVYSHDRTAQTKNVPVPEDDQITFSLTDDEILELARQSLIIEKHYSKTRGRWTPMDIEWAKDGQDGKLYILQARPETVHAPKQEQLYFEEFFIKNKDQYKNKILATGKSVGRKMVTGKAQVINDTAQMDQVKPGEILVTDMTDPDWEPIMKRAGGIVTNRGGRTCHAAIVSRELGIPAIVGTTNATEKIKTGQEITIDCSSGEVGIIYDGMIPFEIAKVEVAQANKRPIEIMINVGNPDEAFSFAKLPNDGVGLARLEFIINSSIKIHPMALIHPERINDKETREKINNLTVTYQDKKQFFIDTLAQEAGTIAAAFYPKPVIVRLSDFKSNEYRNLVGGIHFEPEEENPMLGFRGASRYCHEKYREAFELECLAMKKIREDMGLNNVKLMIPFVRTVAEGEKVIEEMKKHGLTQGENGLEIYMMCEVPSNVIIIDDFCKIFDGLSIGSNDLTQMVLGVDRDSELIASLFDERNPAVKKMLQLSIEGAKRNKKKIGICGQAPSDYPELSLFLIELGIDSLSLNPDAVLKQIASMEG